MHVYIDGYRMYELFYCLVVMYNCISLRNSLQHKQFHTQINENYL